MYNPNTNTFGGGQFIFDTEDGLVAIWTGASNTATVAFDNSGSGAVYKGLALLNGTTLLAANFNSGKVDVLNSNFHLAPISGSFTDPHLPAGYAPHGIHVINNQVYVAYAMQDGAKHDAMPGAGLGQVDIFDMNGNFVSTFVAAGGQLNAPWGVVATPSTFGAFPNAILVGNFGDGTINAYDTTGKFLGQLTNSSNVALTNTGLWDMAFGEGGISGAPGTLYLTAGGGNQPNFPEGGSNTSVFASLVPSAAVGSPNFSLNLSAQSISVAPGGMANLTISAAGVGGFDSPISLSCSAPAGLTCAFSSTTITPGSSTADTLTVSAAATPPSITGYSVSRIGFLLPGLGLFGTVLTTRKRKPLSRKSIQWMKMVGLLLVISLSVAGGRRMRRHWSPNISSGRISGQHERDGYVRCNNSVRPGDHHHQLKRNGSSKGALRCALAGNPVATVFRDFRIIRNEHFSFLSEQSAIPGNFSFDLRVYAYTGRKCDEIGPVVG